MKFYNLNGILNGLGSASLFVVALHTFLCEVDALSMTQQAQSFRVVDDSGRVIGHAHKNYIIPIYSPEECSKKPPSGGGSKPGECEECIGGCGCSEFVVQHNSTCYPSGSGGGCVACPGIVPKYPGCIPKPVVPPVPESCSCNVSCAKPMPPGVYFCDTPQCLNGSCSMPSPDVCHVGAQLCNANSTVPIATSTSYAPRIINPTPIPVPTCEMPDKEGDNEDSMDNVVWECDKGSSPSGCSKKFSHGRWYWSPMAGRWMWEDGKWVLNKSNGQYEFVVGSWQFMPSQDVITSQVGDSSQVLVLNA